VIYSAKKSLSLPKRHEKFSNHAHPIFHLEVGIDSIVITIVEYYTIRSVEWGGSQGANRWGNTEVWTCISALAMDSCRSQLLYL